MLEIANYCVVYKPEKLMIIYFVDKTMMLFGGKGVYNTFGNKIISINYLVRKCFALWDIKFV